LGDQHIFFLSVSINQPMELPQYLSGITPPVENLVTN